MLFSIMRTFFSFLVLLLSLVASTWTSAQNTETNILFVGNSLTYANDLPGLVEAVAAKQGIAVANTMVAFPNYAIEDHWNDGEVQELIANGAYDFVILQQGPSSQPNGRKMLMDYGAKFKTICDKHGAQLSFYMVWPSLNYYSTFEGVITNYRDAAEFNDAILCPVGEVWKAFIDAEKNYDYYGPDGFHPSVKGSQVAAEVIVQSLF
jgi:lysophospholipase L1-like esterase